MEAVVFLAAEVSPVEAEASAAAAQEGAGKRMKKLFSISPMPKIDHDRVVAAIKASELKTSGEIRVVLAWRKASDAVAAARRQFERLGMTRTRYRNGVLVFLAPRSRTFAVIGDTGVHEKCGDDFWRELTASMGQYFKRGEFTAGLVHGIERAGSLLAEHFPYEPGDCNELPDSIEEIK